MFYCYIYLEARVRISHREDFRIVDTPESFLTLYKIPLKLNVLRLIFSNIAGLHLQRLFRKKHHLRYIFKTRTLRTAFLLKHMWRLLR